MIVLAAPRCQRRRMKRFASALMVLALFAVFLQAAPTHYGVIETSTGDLKRAGYCDFSADGNFDGGTETQRTDCPQPAKTRGEAGQSQMHRWNGSAWVLVAQP